MPNFTTLRKAIANTGLDIKVEEVKPDEMSNMGFF